MANRQRSRVYERFMEQARDREQRARELRESGKTFEQIGDLLGVTRQAAFEMVRRAAKAS